MSTSYFLYTEAYIDDKWVCINPGFDKEGERRLAMTYESGAISARPQTRSRKSAGGCDLKVCRLNCKGAMSVAGTMSS